MPTLAIPAISARTYGAMTPVFLPNADGNIGMLWHMYKNNVDYALPENTAGVGNFIKLKSALTLSHYKRGFWKNNQEQLAKLLPKYDAVLLGLPCPNFPVPFKYVLNASKQEGIKQPCDEWFEADVATASSPNCKIVHVLDEGQANALVYAGIPASKINIGKYRYIDKAWLESQVRYTPLPYCDALVTFKNTKEHEHIIARLAEMQDKIFIATNEVAGYTAADNIAKADVSKHEVFSWYRQKAKIVPYGNHTKIYRLGIAEALALGATLFETI